MITGVINSFFLWHNIDQQPKPEYEKTVIINISYQEKKKKKSKMILTWCKFLQRQKKSSDSSWDCYKATRRNLLRPALNFL